MGLSPGHPVVTSIATSNLTLSKDKQQRKTKMAPAVPYYIVRDGLVWTTRVLGVDPETNAMVEGTIADRTTQCLKNLLNLLEAAGSGSDKIVKVSVFITDINNGPLMNEAYDAFFADPKPARSCVAVRELTMTFGTDVSTDVEISCVAAL